jgi:putative hydrolase of the HAD superfamily
LIWGPVLVNKIKAVVFDYGNVLARIDRPAWCSRFARHCPLSAEEVCARVFDSDIERDAETGRIDSRGHFEAIKKSIQADGDWSYDQFRAEYLDGLALIEEGVEALRMAAESKRVFILSNTTYLHSLWLYGQETLATIPELHVFSFKVGVMKPDPGIWQTMMRMGRVEPGECLYIDDIPEYCEAAEKLGIPTINYQVGSTDLQGELNKWL